MADKSVEIKITGLRELATAFKAVDAQLPKNLRGRFKAIADKVVGRAQQRMPFRTGAAAHSLKAVAGATYAGISRPAGGTPWRGEKADYYPWLDFGGSTGKGHKPRVGWSGSVKRAVPKGGRYLYPAITESTADLIEAAGQAIVDTAKEQNFEAH